MIRIAFVLLEHANDPDVLAADFVVFFDGPAGLRPYRYGQAAGGGAGAHVLELGGRRVEVEWGPGEPSSDRCPPEFWFTQTSHPRVVTADLARKTITSAPRPWAAPWAGTPTESPGLDLSAEAEAEVAGVERPQRKRKANKLTETR